MSYTTKNRIKAAAFFTLVAAYFALMLGIFLQGTYCDWGWFTKVGFASQVWGVCK